MAFTATGLTGIDPVSGAELWSFPLATDFVCNTANAVQMDKDHVLISAGENHGAALLRFITTGNTRSVSDVWTSYGKDSQLRANWQTPVLHEGHLYGLDNSGSEGPITNLACIRVSEGKPLWKKSQFGKSNLVVADGMLWLTTMDGELFAVEASPSPAFDSADSATGSTVRDWSLRNALIQPIQPLQGSFRRFFLGDSYPDVSHHSSARSALLFRSLGARPQSLTTGRLPST